VGLWLLAASVSCEALSVGSARFIFELCHRGVPMMLPVMILPIAGALCAATSFFFPPKAMWATSTKLVALAANALQVASGAMIVAGPGLVSCG